jgi:mono/diheme cytochrome c family protein
VLQSDLSHGCLADVPTDQTDAPQFPIDEGDRSAIRTVLTDAFHTLARDDRAEFSERQIQLLNCNACHARDDQPDRWNQLKGELAGIEQTLGPAAAKMEQDVIGDQSRPDLTWTGEKLKPQWMAEFIYGQVDYKPRHWLVARMPSFASRSKLLAEGMALQHGFTPDPHTDPARDEVLADIGRQLSGREGGFSCITCHGVADMPPIGAFEAQTINFMYTAERMTHDFYLRWVRDPLRYQPGTRMPAYTDLDGRTALRDILNGEGSAQFEAIWQYLLAGRDIQPPE